MIRAATADDTAAIIEIVVSAGMFSADEAPFLEGMLAEYFGEGDGHVCVVDDEGGPRGVAYYQPTTAADRVSDLTMIAVRPDHQGRGRGVAMLRRVEEDLRARDQRMLLVETSSLPQYERARVLRKVRLRGGGAHPRLLGGGRRPGRVSQGLGPVMGGGRAVDVGKDPTRVGAGGPWKSGRRAVEGRAFDSSVELRRRVRPELWGGVSWARVHSRFWGRRLYSSYSWNVSWREVL